MPQRDRTRIRWWSLGGFFLLVTVAFMAWLMNRGPLPSPAYTIPAVSGGHQSHPIAPSTESEYASETAAHRPVLKVDPRQPVTVRRLYDGECIPRLAMVFPSGNLRPDGLSTTTTDDEGRIQVAPDDLANVVSAGHQWKVVSQVAEEIRNSSTFWVFDTIRIRAVVEFQPEGVPGDFESVAFRTLLSMPDSGEAPRSEAWLRAHKVEPGPIEGGSEGGTPGCFSVTVPRWKRMTVVAWKEGWRPATATIDVPLDIPEMEIRLVMTPGLRIEGVLRDEHGDPIPNAVIDVFVVRWIPWDQDRRLTSELSRSFSPNGGVGLATTKDGRLQVRIRERAISDARGRFVAFTKSDGQVGLYIYEKGRSGVRAALGELRADLSGLSLSAPSVRGGPFVAISNGGTTLAGTELSVLDCTDPLNPSTIMQVDSEGRIPANWLQSGHLYHVRLQGNHGVRGFVRWESQDRIDLGALPKECADDN